MNPPPVAPLPSPATSPPDWRTWLLIGATGFGGPAAQIALLHRELVERCRSLDEEEFLAAMRICMLLPGPEAQQLATYAGWRAGGWRHGLLSGSLFILPGAVLVTALAWLHAVNADVPLVAAAFNGARPVVVALVAFAAWRIGRRSITSVAAAAVAVVAMAALGAGAPFPLVMLLAGLVGFLTPTPLSASSVQAETPPVGPGPARDATDTPHPGTLRHPISVLLVAVALWLAAYGAIGALPLAPQRGRDIAKLFTETTLLSFGGAYAVVPWALDESGSRGWIRAPERFDALAMGEATPGPLILVVTFVGFLAGYRLDADPLAGLSGAAIATWFSFLPSFAMILALAPFVGRIRASSRLGNSLAAVGGVIVAAIVLLGIRLAMEALSPEGHFDPVACLVAIAAGIALLEGWPPAPIVVVLAAGIGVARMLAG